MGARRSAFQYLVAALLLFPAIALAECVEWWECPYVSPPGMPDTRYVSIDDLRLPFKWKEIEVDGNKALVCLEGEMPPGPRARCTPVNRGKQLEDLLVPPRKPYFDGTEIKFREERRPFDPRAIRKRIQDSAITYDDLRGRNPQ